jgi:hypothetical protein
MRIDQKNQSVSDGTISSSPPGPSAAGRLDLASDCSTGSAAAGGDGDLACLASVSVSGFGWSESDTGSGGSSGAVSASIGEGLSRVIAQKFDVSNHRHIQGRIVWFR